MTKHTPGPWTVGAEDGWDCVKSQSGDIIARLHLNNPDNVFPLAASLDLLAALKAVLPTLTNTVGGRATTQHKMAQKAIAKAEGKG